MCFQLWKEARPTRNSNPWPQGGLTLGAAAGAPAGALLRERTLLQRRDDGEELALLGKTEYVRKSQVCDRCRPAAAGDSDSEGGDEGLSSAVALSMWMIMLSAVTSARSLMLIVLFFLTYAHTHVHFKKTPSNRSFPKGPCGRCKGGGRGGGRGRRRSRGAPRHPERNGSRCGTGLRVHSAQCTLTRDSGPLTRHSVARPSAPRDGHELASIPDTAPGLYED